MCGSCCGKAELTLKEGMGPREDGPGLELTEQWGGRMSWKRGPVTANPCMGIKS